MGADADHDQPLLLAFFHAGFIRFRVAQFGDVHRFRLLDILRRAVADEDRLAAPDDLDFLAFGDRADIDFRARQRKDIRTRVHAIDQWPNESGGTDGTHRLRSKQQEIAALAIRRHGEIGVGCGIGLYTHRTSSTAWGIAELELAISQLLAASRAVKL